MQLQYLLSVLCITPHFLVTSYSLTFHSIFSLFIQYLLVVFFYALYLMLLYHCLTAYCMYTCMPVSVNYSLMKANVGLLCYPDLFASYEALQYHSVIVVCILCHVGNYSQTILAVMLPQS